MKLDNFDNVYDNLSVTEGKFHQYHKKRYLELFNKIPIGDPEQIIIDVGACDVTAQLLVKYSNYKQIVAVTHPSYKLRYQDSKVLNIQADLDFDEVDSTTPSNVAICTEMLEHCSRDPMNVLAQINKNLKQNGLLFFSVPNICSLASLQNIIMGRHPQLTATYDVKSTNRHNREYTPSEVKSLIELAGFEILEFVSIDPWPTQPSNIKVNLQYPGRDIFVTAKKISPIKERFPSWLYHNF